MAPKHHMILEQDNRHEKLFVCPHDGCGRRLVLSRTSGLTVLEQGDFFALHRGGTPALEISADL